MGRSNKDLLQLALHAQRLLTDVKSLEGVHSHAYPPIPAREADNIERTWKELLRVVTWLEESTKAQDQRTMHTLHKGLALTGTAFFDSAEEMLEKYILQLQRRTDAT